MLRSDNSGVKVVHTVFHKHTFTIQIKFLHFVVIQVDQEVLLVVVDHCGVAVFVSATALNTSFLLAQVNSHLTV
jgi:hypothetical protein